MTCQQRAAGCTCHPASIPGFGAVGCQRSIVKYRMSPGCNFGARAGGPCSSTWWGHRESTSVANLRKATSPNSVPLSTATLAANDATLKRPNASQDRLQRFLCSDYACTRALGRTLIATRTTLRRWPQKPRRSMPSTGGSLSGGLPFPAPTLRPPLRLRQCRAVCLQLRWMLELCHTLCPASRPQQHRQRPIKQSSHLLASNQRLIGSHPSQRLSASKQPLSHLRQSSRLLANVQLPPSPHLHLSLQ